MRSWHPSSVQPSDDIPAASRSIQTMFVSTGRVNFPPLLVHMSEIFLAFLWHSISFPPSPLGPWPKVSSTATLAAAAMTPDCLVPPPIDLRNHRAFLINSVDPTKILPMGAPSPLEKHKLTLSNKLA